jgi:hypothetical protein
VTSKTTIALLLILTSTSLFADRPDCSLTPGDCANPNGNAYAYGRTGGEPDNANVYSDSGVVDNHAVAAVPEPSSLALLTLGVAGMAIARKRKR